MDNMIDSALGFLLIWIHGLQVGLLVCLWL